MSIATGKFKIINELRQDPVLRKWIPDFWLALMELRNDEYFFDGVQKFILRSAVKGEGSEFFGSGKSLSVKGIMTSDEYAQALDSIIAQENIAEIILQKEVQLTHHYTSFISSEWSYCEETFKMSGARSLISRHFLSKGIAHHDEFEQIVNELLVRKVDSVIVEWGVENSQIFIFQVTPILKREIKSYTESRMIHHLYDTFLRWQHEKTLYCLIKEEWKSVRVRSKLSSATKFSMNDLFENWTCILHYYYLYCILNRMKSNTLSWVHFLKSTYKKSYLSSAALDHIKIANSLSIFLGIPGPSAFKENDGSLIFLGQGVWSGIIRECLFVENLEADFIYANEAGRVIFTKDSRMLSHGFLAATETLTKVVCNLDAKTWSSLQNANHVRIDFDKGFIEKH